GECAILNAKSIKGHNAFADVEPGAVGKKLFMDLWMLVGKLPGNGVPFLQSPVEEFLVSSHGIRERPVEKHFIDIIHVSPTIDSSTRTTESFQVDGGRVLYSFHQKSFHHSPGGRSSQLTRLDPDGVWNLNHVGQIGRRLCTLGLHRQNE